MLPLLPPPTDALLSDVFGPPPFPPPLAPPDALLVNGGGLPFGPLVTASCWQSEQKCRASAFSINLASMSAAAF